MQGEPLLPEGAVFIAQLAPDLFDCDFGDVGSLFAFRVGDRGLGETQGH